MPLRVDRMVYFDVEADADTYITALIGVANVDGTKITSASNATLVVTTSLNPELTPGRLPQADNGQNVYKSIRKLV